MSEGEGASIRQELSRRLDARPLAQTDQRPLTCEEKLKAAEAAILNLQKVLENLKDPANKIRALENEVKSLRRLAGRNIDAMSEYLDLIETLDFKVQMSRLMFMTDNEFVYLRFDRNGQIKHAWTPQEYNRVIAEEWSNL